MVKLAELRSEHGDDCVTAYGEVQPPAAVLEVDADVLVPAALEDAIDADLAKRIHPQLIVEALFKFKPLESLQGEAGRGVGVFLMTREGKLLWWDGGSSAMRDGLITESWFHTRDQYAVDAFPQEEHNPFSDHNDFINVNSAQTMQKIATCINKGKTCR